ncbi:S-adenosyl-L-methionine-dependent methyltransferase [Cokeromyces recurvatus]|uniref:S-adenosyl-L-methionine-dependent methyltransferase n=1 Tax=Cokeromyces recurvatus TaxID=90255 RepID=UPI00221EE533|nr:S-adenosyl-L-methionine-dependent methyltransferase [Cokeromyces recurvatus]KAI7901521.1 S-adenosyl-L-methionine-dependent methyltransferase [Cokeromyces recurvatus]
MGYGKKKRGANKRQNKTDSTGEKKQKYFDERTPYADIERDNLKFKEYYQKQNILPPEEFEEFYSFIKTILPSTFRITGSRATAMEILNVVQNTYVPNMQNVVIDGVKIEPPKPLPWYPDNLGWQVNAPRLVIKKSPEFQKFHKFMVTETEAGNISRQEAVSMVPPLLMDIKPHQWVLDMCAAPGSKTAQIIEAVHSNDKLNEMPTGLVVANDADYKRSHMLVHQSKRLQSPCFMATNHDGAHFPNIHVPCINAQDDQDSLPWQFDRVLCDVPCSGDGTIRKNEKIWSNWSHNDGLQLHSTQVQIFARGCQLVKLGGRIVYSTCSFNPIENEAVVAEVLRQTKGAIQLVDVSTSLPELKRRPGLSTWKVTNKDGVFIDSIEDIPERRQRAKFPRSAFPPTPEEAKEMHLERCIRIYPHHQDTGGFFVAVFEKVKPLTAADRISLARSQGKNVSQNDVEEAKKEMDVVEDKEGNVALNDMDEVIPTKRTSTDKEEGDHVEEGSVKKIKTDKTEEEEEEKVIKPYEGKPKKDVPGIKEAPFEMMPSNSNDLDEITQFYGLDPKFPRDQFLLRSDGNAKGRSLYFVSSSIKRVIESKDFSRLQTVNTGVRLFVRQSSPVENGSPFRLTSEGLPILDTVLSDKRRITIDLETLKTLLVEAFPILEEFSEEVRKMVTPMENGCCIAHVKTDDENNKFKFTVPLILPVWKGKNSLNVLLNKNDKRALCQRIFGIIPGTTPEHLLQRSLENQKEKLAADAAAAAAAPASVSQDESNTA